MLKKVIDSLISKISKVSEKIPKIPIRKRGRSRRGKLEITKARIPTIINEYRFIYIDIKNIITFISLKIKKVYNLRYQIKFFEKKDLVNLRFYREYRISIITFKKIK